MGSSRLILGGGGGRGGGTKTLQQNEKKLPMPLARVPKLIFTPSSYQKIKLLKEHKN